MDERQLSSPNLSGLDPFAYEPQRIEKPWGWELLWARSETYVGKLLFVRAGQALSLQFHNVKDESWYVYEGRAALDDTLILEVSTPHLDDIVRLEDRYGRVGS